MFKKIVILVVYLVIGYPLWVFLALMLTAMGVGESENMLQPSNVAANLAFIIIVVLLWGVHMGLKKLRALRHG